MRIISGQWQDLIDQYDIFLFSATGEVKNGELIPSGKSLAEMFERWPKAPSVWGKRVKETPLVKGSHRYLILPSSKQIGLWQRSYKSGPADIDMIVAGAKLLVQMIDQDAPTAKVGFIVPGTGKGGIEFEKVCISIAPYLDDRFTGITATPWQQRKQWKKIASGIADIFKDKDPDDLFYSWEEDLPPDDTNQAPPF